MAKYPKGSEWRIWDLHIHTPGTAKNDQYGNDEAAWEAYIAKLEENTDVAVLGITDYFSSEKSDFVMVPKVHLLLYSSKYFHISLSFKTFSK